MAFVMEIYYKNNKLKMICTNYQKAVKSYNVNVAEKLFKSINYIENATSLVDIINYPPFKFHDLKGNKKNFYAIDLGRRLGFRMIIQAIDDNNNICTNEQVFSVDAVKISIISVEEVSNHYE